MTRLAFIGFALTILLSRLTAQEPAARPAWSEHPVNTWVLQSPREGQAVHAERNVQPCIVEALHRCSAGAQPQVRARIYGDRDATLGKQLHFIGLEPDAARSILRRSATNGIARSRDEFRPKVHLPAAAVHFGEGSREAKNFK